MKKLSVAVVLLVMVLTLVTANAANAFAADHDGDMRPGWGFGDTHHVHTGPPGQSVRPVNVDQHNHINLSQIFHINGKGHANIFVQVMNYFGHNIFHLS